VDCLETITNFWMNEPTIVAKGDLNKKVTVHAIEMDPEITTFKNTINTMTDQLQTFASEVSRVAREVGTEGRLGGQAKIAGVEGTWMELTNNGICNIYTFYIFASFHFFFFFALSRRTG